MKKIYPRICSNCGRRFVGKKMDYRCAICRENKRVTCPIAPRITHLGHD